MNSPVPIGRIQYTIITMQKKAQKPKKNNAKNGGTQRPSSGKPLPPGRPVGAPRYSKEFPKKNPISAAVAYAAGQSTSAPKITANRNSARIVHRELVTKVAGTGSYTVAASLALNPGLASTFPWLSTQAGAWETYRFNKLRFCYYTRCSSATPGSVQLVPDYDPADAAPGSEFIAASFEDVQEDAPWKDICCELRPDAMFPMGPKKFIRQASLAANQDIKTYDAGNLFVTTTDGAVTNWGLVWVEYDVTLFTPQTPSAGFAASQHLLSSAAPSTAAFMGLTQTTSAGSSTLVTLNANNVVTFAVSGRYLVQYNATSTTDTQSSPPAVSASGSLVTTFGLGGTGLFVAGSGTAAFSQTVVLDAVVGTTLTYTNTVVGGLLGELIVSRLPQTQA